MSDQDYQRLIPQPFLEPGHGLAAAGIIASVFNVLPTLLGIIAGLLGIAWYGVLFYDRFWKKPKQPS